MEKNGAACAKFSMRRCVVLNKKFQGVGWIILPHAIEKMVIGKGFVGVQNEMAIVVQGSGIFDPKIPIGDAVVAPTWKGELGGVSIQSGAQQKYSSGRLFIAFAFLNAVLCRVNPSAPSESVAAEVNLLGEAGCGPGRGGKSSAKELKICLSGIPVVGHG